MPADAHPRGGAVVSVLDHGARGDGVSDDTAAVQAAIDAGGITFFPAGEYSCRTLVMRRSTRLAGVNSGTYGFSSRGYTDDHPPTEVSKLVRREGTNAPLVLGPPGAKRVILEDLQLHGNNGAQDSGRPHVVEIADAPHTEDTQWLVSRCYIRGKNEPGSAWGSGGSNIYIGSGRMACHVVHTVSSYANHHGLEINGADALVQACIIGDNGAHGLVVSAWVTTISGCAVFNNEHGIYVSDTGEGSPKRIIITANGIDRNRQNGILVDRASGSGAAGVSITDNGFTSNGTDDDGAWAHVNIRATTGHVALGGNVFSVVEDGYAARTAAAVMLDPGASALDMGNVYEGGSVAGFSNRPDALYTRTRMG